MTDKPIDLSAKGARIQLRDHQRQMDTDGTCVGVSRQALDEVLDALDARETLVIAGNGQHFTTAQAEQIAERLELYHGHESEMSVEAKDACRLIRYLAASLDKANIEVHEFRNDVRSAEKGADEWKSKALKLEAQLADAKALGDAILERHNAYVTANPAPVRLAGGQVVRFVSPVTPQEVQILSDDPTRDADDPNQLENIEISGQAEMTLPEGVDTFPTDAIMPEIAETPAALEMAEIIKRPSLTPETILAAAQVLENELAELKLFMTTAAKYDLAKRMLLAAGMGEA